MNKSVCRNSGPTQFLSTCETLLQRRTNSAACVTLMLNDWRHVTVTWQLRFGIDDHGPAMLVALHQGCRDE